MSYKQINEDQSVLIDLIRFLLAVTVLIGHGFGFFFGYFDNFFPVIFPHIQSIAVVGFFYLSGYLIVGSVLQQKLKSNKIDLWTYLFDRTIRIYVTLIPSILFVAITDLFFKNYTVIHLNLVYTNSSFILLMKNLLLIPSMPYGTLRPIWSLMYEWWIYLFFGGLFFLKKNVLIAPLFIFIGFYYTILINAQGNAGHIWIIWGLGGFCAFVQRYILWERITLNVHNLLIVFFLVAAALIYFLTKEAYNITAGISLVVSIFLMINYRGKLLSYLVLIKNPIRKLAGLSFTLFLTHYTILTYTKEFLGFQGMKGLIFGALISIYIAYCIAYFTEYRLKEIKKAILFIISRIFVFIKYNSSKMEKI